ncbi:MAG TPA: hypothetical protein VNO30_06210 [Kofleriaceae bacterium]|nr:hypothetical protein [Kofleriaceae bacterium]
MKRIEDREGAQLHREARYHARARPRATLGRAPAPFAALPAASAAAWFSAATAGAARAAAATAGAAGAAAATAGAAAATARAAATTAGAAATTARAAATTAGAAATLGTSPPSNVAGSSTASSTACASARSSIRRARTETAPLACSTTLAGSLTEARTSRTPSSSRALREASTSIALTAVKAGAATAGTTRATATGTTLVTAAHTAAGTARATATGTALVTAARTAAGTTRAAAAGTALVTAACTAARTACAAAAGTALITAARTAARTTCAAAARTALVTAARTAARTTRAAAAGTALVTAARTATSAARTAADATRTAAAAITACAAPAAGSTRIASASCTRATAPIAAAARTACVATTVLTSSADAAGSATRTTASIGSPLVLRRIELEVALLVACTALGLALGLAARLVRVSAVTVFHAPVVDVIDPAGGIRGIDLARQIQIELIRLGLGARLRAGAPRDVRGLAARAPGASGDGAAIQADHVAQLVQLLLVELARVADAQVVERQVRERHSLELVDAEPERLDHAVDLAVLALVDGHRDPRVLALTGEELHLSRHRDRAVVELHALAQLLQVLLCEPAMHLDVIRFRDVARRSEQPRRELPVVGQEQHAFRIEVEPADWLDWHWQVRQVVHHRRAAAVVGHRGDAPFRLIEQDIEGVERDDGLAIDLDLIVLRVDLGAEDGHHLAVDHHAPGGDELLGFPSGRDTRGSQVPLQTYGCPHGSLRCGILRRLGRALLCNERRLGHLGRFDILRCGFFDGRRRQRDGRPDLCFRRFADPPRPLGPLEPIHHGRVRHRLDTRRINAPLPILRFDL